ncbi:hypothetical protein [Segeticoccus rhizosphaerae]|uniref:hypothetical protein n=1 Tax=Segeticoccus rhizosphaerae TaxID=1104777 RepID=UPI0010C0E8F9|nr:hypothetical protein [Ornithinicoccus soli]
MRHRFRAPPAAAIAAPQPAGGLDASGLHGELCGGVHDPVGPRAGHGAGPPFAGAQRPAGWARYPADPSYFLG